MWMQSPKPSEWKRKNLGIELVLQNGVLHPQHTDVVAQRHLTDTVAMEVKLVFLEDCKMLDDLQEVLQSL